MQVSHVARIWAAFLIVVAFATTLSACGGAEARKARHMERGQAFFADGNFEKARIEYRNAMQIDPNSAEARFMSGQVAERLQNMREAAGLYQAAIDADPNHVKARANLAKLFVFAGAPDRGLELIKPALEQGEDPDLLAVRGAARLMSGDLRGAFADASRAVELAPDSENAIALLVSVYQQGSEHEKAIALLKDATQRLPKSVDLRLVLAQLYDQRGDRAAAEVELKRLIELAPLERNHRMRLALFYLAGKDVDRAEAVLREAVERDPKSTESKLALVDFLAAQRSRAAAELALEDYIKTQPEAHELRFGLARLYEGTREFDKAEAVYRAVIERDGVRASGLTARNRIAAIKAGASKFEEAQVLIAEVLEVNPRDNDALILRGNIALARNQPAAAVVDLRAVLKDQPDATGVLRALARAHLKNGEPALAESTLRKAVETNPRDVDVRIDLAQLLAQRGQLDTAKELLIQLVRDEPTNLPAREALFRTQVAGGKLGEAGRTAEDIKILRPDQAVGFYLAGLVAQAGNLPEDAAREFERALELQPDAGEPLTGLVRVRLAQKKPEAALAATEEVSRKFPDNVVARNLRAEVLIAMGRHAQAVEAFKDITQKAPNWWVPYRGLAMAQLALGNRAGAIEACRAGLDANPDAVPLAVDLASLYEQDGQPDEAIRQYEAILARSAATEMPANNLAMLLVTYRSDQASLDRARDLVAPFASSSNPAYLNTHGWVKFKRGEYAAALPALEQAVEKAPDSPVMRYHLGMAQFRSGQLELARANLERSLKTPARFTGSEEARSTLEQLKKRSG